MCRKWFMSSIKSKDYHQFVVSKEGITGKEGIYRENKEIGCCASWFVATEHFCLAPLIKKKKKRNKKKNPKIVFSFTSLSALWFFDIYLFFSNINLTLRNSTSLDVFSSWTCSSMLYLTHTLTHTCTEIRRRINPSGIISICLTHPAGAKLSQKCVRVDGGSAFWDDDEGNEGNEGHCSGRTDYLHGFLYKAWIFWLLWGGGTASGTASLLCYISEDSKALNGFTWCWLDWTVRALIKQSKKKWWRPWWVRCKRIARHPFPPLYCQASGLLIDPT